MPDAVPTCRSSRTLLKPGVRSVQCSRRTALSLDRLRELNQSQHTNLGNGMLEIPFSTCSRESLLNNPCK